MRITRATLRVVGGPLQRPTANARASWATREGLILRLEDEDGRVGQGEASPLPGYSPDDLAGCAHALEDVHLRIGSPELDAQLAPLPAARFALETALLDLTAQSRGESIATVLGKKSLLRVPRSGLVDLDERACEVAKGLLARGVRTLKVKIGSSTLDADLEKLAALRSEVGMPFTLRLDANGAWSLDEARKNLARLAPLAPELCEEPAREGDLARLGRCAIPWAADESLQNPANVRAMLDDPACEVLVLKPALLGGLAVARALAEQATARGKQVIVTHMFEGPIAMAAACELALSLSVTPLACGLDLHRALACFPSLEIPHLREPGFIVPSGGIGLGLPHAFRTAS